MNGFLRAMFPYLVVYALVVSVGGVLQADGRGRRLLVATLLGFAVQLPLAYALAAALGSAGVWLAMTAGTALQALLICPWGGRCPVPGGDAAAGENQSTPAALESTV